MLAVDHGKSARSSQSGYVYVSPNHYFPGHVCNIWHRHLSRIVPGVSTSIRRERCPLSKSSNSKRSVRPGSTALCSSSGCATEKLVPDGTTPMSGTLEEDMEGLQELLQENSPAYILARLDGSASAWLAITYVPDSAKVRDKVRSCTRVVGALSAPQYHSICRATDALRGDAELLAQIAWFDTLYGHTVCHIEG